LCWAQPVDLPLRRQWRRETERRKIEDKETTLCVYVRYLFYKNPKTLNGENQPLSSYLQQVASVDS